MSEKSANDRMFMVRSPQIYDGLEEMLKAYCGKTLCVDCDWRHGHAQAVKEWFHRTGAVPLEAGWGSKITHSLYERVPIEKLHEAQQVLRQIGTPVVYIVYDYE